MIDIDALSGSEITALMEKVGYDTLALFCNKDEFISEFISLLSNETLLDAIVNDNKRDIEDIVIKLCLSLPPFPETKTHTQETVDETQVMFTQIMDKLISESDGNSPQGKDEKTRLTRFKKDMLAEKFSN